MEIHKLGQMTKGWFVGDFSPTVAPSENFEVAFKEYKKGESEAKHYHKISKEITLIAKGKVIMFDRTFESGDIISIEPNEATAFEALEDTWTVVVKIPSSKNDKYLS